MQKVKHYKDHIAKLAKDGYTIKQIVEDLRQNYGIIAKRQSVLYWAKQANNYTDKIQELKGLPFKEKKKFVVNNESELRQLSKDDFMKDMSAVERLAHKVHKRILIICDIHAPYQHKSTLNAIKFLKKRFNPDLVICTGDEVDNHAMSMHDSDPDLSSAGDELQKAQKVMKELWEVCPEMYLCFSNHGSMAFRRAKKFGIPRHLIVPYRDALFSKRKEDGTLVYNGGDDWHWAESIVVKTPKDDVLFMHDLGTANPTINMEKHGMSCVQGHYHAQPSLKIKTNRKETMFGMTVGAMLDDKSLAYVYNKLQPSRPSPVFGVILNGEPHLIHIALDENDNVIDFGVTEHV